MTEELPLFPLKTVLFPGGRLPLRIFEPRYVDMVGETMRQQGSFGVVAIREGEETGEATTYKVATLATIVDFDQGADGLLGIVAEGGERVRIESTRRQADGLLVGEVTKTEAEPKVTLPEEFDGLAKLLGELLDNYEADANVDQPRSLDDAGWVGFRLCEILPIGLGQRQFLLEVSDPVQRLKVLKTLVEALAQS